MRPIVTVLTLGLSQALSAQGLPDLSRIEPTPPIAGRWNLPVQSGANVNGRLCALSDSAAAAAVRARLEAWVRQTNDGDGAGARDVWATNVVGWLPRAGVFSDSAAQAVAGISAATGPARVRYQLSIEDVAASGPIVAVHDIWREIRTWATIAVERVIRGSELWRCQPDGQWRIVRYVSAPEPWRRVPR